MTKKLVAEFIGTFWLVSGDAGASFLLPRFRTWESVSSVWLWPLVLPC